MKFLQRYWFSAQFAGLLLIHIGLAIYIYPTMVDLLTGLGGMNKLSGVAEFFFAVFGFTKQLPTIFFPVFLAMIVLDWKQTSSMSQKFRVITLTLIWLVILVEFYVLATASNLIFHGSLIQQIQ